MVSRRDYTGCPHRVSVEQLPGMNYERKIRQEYMGNSSVTVPVGPCLCPGHDMAGQLLLGSAGPGPLLKGHLEIQRKERNPQAPNAVQNRNRQSRPGRGQHCPEGAPRPRARERSRAGNSSHGPLWRWEIGAPTSQGYSRSTPAAAPAEQLQGASERLPSFACVLAGCWPDARGDPQPRRKHLGVPQPLQELRNRGGVLCPHVPRAEDSKGQVDWRIAAESLLTRAPHAGVGQFLPAACSFSHVIFLISLLFSLPLVVGKLHSEEHFTVTQSVATVVINGACHSLNFQPGCVPSRYHSGVMHILQSENSFLMLLPL
ncbi:uncharacterized protein LOC135291252 [Passer domesticus]|uniref:uncharacterized protein LOC135291252 n=1 Tax=Passer domesticus TaxID=48849 RepID=UPI0030FE02A4